MTILLPSTPVSHTQTLIKLSRSGWIKSRFSFGRIHAESGSADSVAIGSSNVAVLPILPGAEAVAVNVVVPEALSGKVS